MMWEILTAPIVKKYIIRLNVTDYFQKNRKDGAGEQVLRHDDYAQKEDKKCGKWLT